VLRSRFASAFVLISALVAVAGATARPPAAVPPLPRGWPRTLQIGMADSPGGAAALRRAAPFGFRYQYLAGGVNTGNGWATWNPNGTFAATKRTPTSRTSGTRRR
jgi:hypothetical protein